ncbi:hypothetical protein [Aristophania vespae]|uniref:hypothetical protein n=1 Tax=Aristophania vespae TaxID=2697033 RepID=UPI00191C2BCF|nr:hypothetical protein [Aristophania vespae]UMM63524.1 hypothetical protein DM15PD_04980 [Aristophania vespae]
MTLRRIAFAALTFTALSGQAALAHNAGHHCRDEKGHFAKCHKHHKAKKHCRDEKGKFTKCASHKKDEAMQHSKEATEQNLKAPAENLQNKASSMAPDAMKSDMPAKTAQVPEAPTAEQ